MSSARLHEMVAAYGAGAYRDSEAIQNLDEVMTLLTQVVITDPAPAALDIIVVPAVCVCVKCGAKVVQDDSGSWIDSTGGDGCDIGVHAADAEDPLEEPAVACPHCQARDNIELVDISERWNPAEPQFEGGKLVAFAITAQDGDHENDRFKCGSCDKTITVPADVEDVWP